MIVLSLSLSSKSGFSNYCRITNTKLTTTTNHRDKTKQGIGKIKIPSLPVLFSKHGKNDTSKVQLVLLLLLIGWKAGVRFLSQSQSVAIVIIAQLLLTVIWKPRSKWVACTMWIAKCKKCRAVWKLSKRGIKCLTFNDLVTVIVIFLKIAVCLMLILNTKPWFIIGGWLQLSSAINWTSIRFMVILTIFCSGLSSHLYQVVALSNRSATDVVRILLTISPTAIKHCGQTCWQTLVYSLVYTNTYYHPALSHIKRGCP